MKMFVTMDNLVAPQVFAHFLKDGHHLDVMTWLVIPGNGQRANRWMMDDHAIASFVVVPIIRQQVQIGM